MELDRVLPSYDFRSCLTRRISAAPEATWAAMGQVTGAELPLMRLLMSIRSASRARSRGPLLDAIPMPTLIRVEGQELVLGTVAQFWRFRPARPAVPVDDLAAFLAFAQPGWVKSAASLRVEPAPDGAGTIATFETRVQATDAAARRAFGRYWRLIRAGGADLIRVEMLRATARRAENPVRPAPAQAPSQTPPDH